MESEEEILPCMIFIDRDGVWHYKGAEMRDRETIRLFYRHMHMDARGRYIIELNGERCYVEAEDTAFVVRSAVSGGKFILSLSDDSEEELLPETLFVGGENVLYCKTKGGFPARFARPAYYQLAGHVIEKNGASFLPVEGRLYEIRHGAAEEPGGEMKPLHHPLR